MGPILTHSNFESNAATVLQGDFMDDLPLKLLVVIRNYDLSFGYFIQVIQGICLTLRVILLDHVRRYMVLIGSLL